MKKGSEWINRKVSGMFSRCYYKDQWSFTGIHLHPFREEADEQGIGTWRNTDWVLGHLHLIKNSEHYMMHPNIFPPPWWMNLLQRRVCWEYNGKHVLTQLNIRHLEIIQSFFFLIHIWSLILYNKKLQSVQNQTMKCLGLRTGWTVLFLDQGL